MNLIKPCECGDISRPVLRGDGLAAQDVAGPGVRSDIYFTTFFGYVVECEKCGRSTKYHMTPDEAIDAWNRGEYEKPKFDEEMAKVKSCLDKWHMKYIQLTEDESL